MYTPMLKNHVNGALETMHFCLVQTSLSLRTKILCISGGPNEWFCIHEKLSWGTTVFLWFFIVFYVFINIYEYVN